MIGALLVIAKNPVPGRVKTRLVPPYTHRQAAALATAALTDTLAAAAAVPARRHVLVFDGDPQHWLPPGWDLIPQAGGDLDVRLAAAFGALSAGDGPAVLVGMDTPQLRAAHLLSIGDDGVDAWLGPAADGGFWLIGFADPSVAPGAITGVPMSRDDTGRHQLDRLRRTGLSVRLLDTLVDVDDHDSAHVVANQAPTTRFARALRAADRVTFADAETAPGHVLDIEPVAG